MSDEDTSKRGEELRQKTELTSMMTTTPMSMWENDIKNMQTIDKYG